LSINHPPKALFEGWRRNVWDSINRIVVPDQRLWELRHHRIHKDAPLSTCKRVFTQLIRMVEIEIHSFCNRACWFCPNSIIDRHSRTLFLDPNIYLRILKDLASVQYRGMMSYSRYNEPFAHEVFYERLCQAREYLPHALLHTNTNGDYLNNESLLKAYESGLRSLNIQIYLSQDQEFSIKIIHDLAQKNAARLSAIEFRPVFRTPDHVEYAGSYEDMTIRMYARDFRINGTNRCDMSISQQFLRMSPCVQPFFSVHIDYNADMVPCCNIRSDLDQHKPFIMGRLTDEENILFKQYYASTAIQWRNRLLNYQLKQYPCKNCNFDCIPDSMINRLVIPFARRS
jgi:hypothetical protein